MKRNLEIFNKYLDSKKSDKISVNEIKEIFNLFDWGKENNNNLDKFDINKNEIKYFNPELIGFKLLNDKKIEFKLGLFLISLALFCIIISLIGNFYYDFQVEKIDNFFEWLIYFVERITGPLLITGSVLFYNSSIYKNKSLENKSAIFWK